MLQLGTYYLSNDSKEKAIKYLKMAIKQSDTMAMIKLASYYQEQNLNELAVKYYKKAADMNSSEAIEFLLERMKGTRNNDEFLVSMNG